jgi:hypothetical protein
MMHVGNSATCRRRKVQSWQDASGEQERVEPSGALLRPRRLKPFRPASPSQAQHEKGTGVARRPPRRAERSKPSRDTLHFAASSCGRSSSLTPSRSSSSARNSGSGPASPSCSCADVTSTRRSGSGNQPESSRRRSASLAISAFFRWSISCADGSPRRVAVRLSLGFQPVANSVPSSHSRAAAGAKHHAAS